MIKAPYNFVPLEKTAFYPEWANHISHDIPFEDGVSGCIEYTMEAKTPIFVRNGYTDRNNPDETFSHTKDGRYFIPGTSVKGEIRNVLEILSFGKMTQVQDARFGIRDLNESQYRNQVKNVHCGWLFCNKNSNEGSKYRLIDCGSPYRISPEDIDDIFGTSLMNFKTSFNAGRNNACKNEEEYLRSSMYKYNEIFKLDLNGCVNCGLQLKKSLHITFNTETDGYKREIAKPNKSGQISGTIVVTGQPDKRQVKKDSEGKQKWIGKYYEFVFPDSEIELDVDALIVRDFFTIHKNNYDFKNLWKENLYHNYKIPVFFTLNGDKIDAIGLSGMFRIPSASFIKGAIPTLLQSNKHKDLAECIFGTADKSLGYLKGRVVFSPAFAGGEVKELETVQTTLSSPKPSYGPLYVEGGTWNSSVALIKGRKRYPVMGRNGDAYGYNDTGNGNNETKFRPLSAGTAFSGKIHFHNLRRVELGALISALSFNGRSECFHSIGEAKPLGYGKVKTEVIRISDYPVAGNETSSGSDVNTKKHYYLKLFEEMMTGFDSHWKSSKSLSQLYAMAKGIPDGRESEFAYMRMSTNSKENEFAQVKKGIENLPSFTEVLEGKKVCRLGADWLRKDSETLSGKIEQLDIMLEQRELVSKRIEQVSRLLEGKEYLQACELASELQKIVEKDSFGVCERFKQDIDILIENVQEGMKKEGEKRKDELQGEVEDLLCKGKDPKIGNAERIKLLEEAISKCDEAVSIDARIENNLLFLNFKEECQRIKVNITNTDVSLYEYLKEYHLASMKAFVSRINRWKTNNGIEAMSKDDLSFLGNYVKNSIGTLRKKEQKSWLDRQSWDKTFEGVLSPESISFVFSIVAENFR